MTMNMHCTRALLAWAICLSGCGGCEDGGGTTDTCTITFTTINGATDVTVLTAKDDRSGDASDGIQVDIVLATVDLDDGTEITLSGGPTDAVANVAGDQVTFSSYTVTKSTKMKEVRLTANAGLGTLRDCEQAQHVLIVNPEEDVPSVVCQITNPKGSLNRDSDQDPATPDVLDVDVTISTNAPDGSDVSLTLSTDSPTAFSTVDGTVATFSAIPFACGESAEIVTLEATVENYQDGTETCSTTVTVNCGSTQCEIVGLTDTNGDDCSVDTALCNAENDASTEAGLQIGVVVATGADSATVELTADGNAIGTATVKGGQGTLDVTLPEGSPVLQATCTDSVGNTQGSAPYAGFLVDTVEPEAVEDLACVVSDNDPAQISCTLTVPDEGPAGTGAELITLCASSTAIDDVTDLEGATCSAASASVGGASQSVDAALGAAGCYFLALLVQDGAGNTSDLVTLSDSVCVASNCTLVPPAAMLNVAQADIAVTSDVGTGGAVTLSINGTASDPVAVADGTAAFSSTSLPEGFVTLLARCTDDAGNNLTSATSTVFVDTIAPTAITDLSCTVTDNRTAVITCTWTAPTETGSGLGSYSLRYVRNGSLTDEGAEIITVNPATTATSYALTNGVDGTIRLGSSYDIALVSTDGAQNASSSSNDLAAIAVTLREVILTESGLETNGALGELLTAGDFNCDGFGDVAAVAITGGGGNGRVYLYFGADASLPTTADVRITGSDEGFGNSIANLGDFNGDGCDDLAVAGREDDNRGRVNIYLGRSFWFDRGESEDDIGAELRILGGIPFAYYGYILVGPGDINGDDIGDMATYSGEEGDELHVVYGASTFAGQELVLTDEGRSPLELTSSDAADIRFQAPEFPSYEYEFWHGIGGGNFNDDEFADVAVISNSSPDGVPKVYVLFGTAADKSADVEILSATDDIRSLELAIAPEFATGSDHEIVAANINGSNGIALGVGTFNSSTGIVELADELAPGNASFADILFATVTNVESPSSGRFLGLSVAPHLGSVCGGVCDIDGDGLGDLLTRSRLDESSNGAVVLYFGVNPFTDRTTNNADMVVAAPADAGTFARRVSFIPDINGDGWVDLAASDISGFDAPGRVFIYY